MKDSNPTRDRRAKNKKAFDEILGDPYSEDNLEGWYNILKARSSIVTLAFDDTHGTSNPARPTPLDFFCDVEAVIHKTIDDPILLDKFIQTYIIGEIGLIETKQRAYLEQKIGSMFRSNKYRISPVKKYFIAVRQRRKHD